MKYVYRHYKDDLTKRSSQPSFKNLPSFLLTAIVAIWLTLLMIGI